MIYVQSAIFSCQKHEPRVWRAWLSTMPSPGWLCSPIAGGNLPLLSPRGESTDAFCIISLHLVSSLLPTFPMCFFLQPCLKGTFSMQREPKSCVYMPFPFWGFYFSSASETSTAAKTQYGAETVPWLSPAQAALPWDRGVCLCKCARVLCAHKNRCVPSWINEAIQSVTKWTIYGQFQQLVRPKEWGGSLLKPSLCCLF